MDCSTKPSSSYHTFMYYFIVLKTTQLINIQNHAVAFFFADNLALAASSGTKGSLVTVPLYLLPTSSTSTSVPMS